MSDPIQWVVHEREDKHKLSRVDQCWPQTQGLHKHQIWLKVPRKQQCRQAKKRDPSTQGYSRASVANGQCHRKRPFVDSQMGRQRTVWTRVLLPEPLHLLLIFFGHTAKSFNSLGNCTYFRYCRDNFILTCLLPKNKNYGEWFTIHRHRQFHLFWHQRKQKPKQILRLKQYNILGCLLFILFFIF